MAPPDGSAAEAFALLDDRALDCAGLNGPGLSGVCRSDVAVFPHPFAANVNRTDRLARLPADLAAALSELAAERGMRADDLLDAARLLCGGLGAAAPTAGKIDGAADGTMSEEHADAAAAEVALAAAGRGPRRIVAATEIDRLTGRADMMAYRGKALTDALERVSFQPLDGGVREVRDAAQIFGFANEWCFDEDRVTRRFRELAPVYHPDTGVVADRERMTQLIEARNLLIRHVRTAYASGGWVGRRR